MRRVTLIAGPTASGKSAAALRIAQDRGAVIVNADSMQVYDGLRVLTARPGPDDLRLAPHHLFGHVPPSTAYSTGQWARDAQAVLERLAPDVPLVFVGGTGLYFRALRQGLSPMPSIDAAVRAHWRAQLKEKGAAVLHGDLAARDPEAAAALEPGDGQRIVRALEVLDASGRSIRWWQQKTGRPLLGDGDRVDAWLILPDRAALHRRIEDRFDRMIDDGALDEVAALRAMGLDPDLPAMKAIGVPELVAVLDGRLPLAAAITRIKAATRQYAKRQMTWWRNRQAGAWQVVDAPHMVAETSP